MAEGGDFERKKGEAFYICSTEADITGQGFVKR